jgi:hypothetical protein
MPKFRKKPVIIDAIKWDGTLIGKHYIDLQFPDIRTTSIEYHEKNNTVNSWYIGTLEGQHRVSYGDYIIRGVKGEYYPCKPDIFEATYEAVTD